MGMIPGQEPYTPEEERLLAEFVHEAALADPGEADEPRNIDVDGHRYTQVDAVQFVRDMQARGLEVMHYRGRFGWEGPAVTTDDLQIPFYATKVKLQWDGMGLGWVVYPKESDRGAEVRDETPCRFEGGWCVAHSAEYHSRGEGGLE